jgi:hypothetical protein
MGNKILYNQLKSVTRANRALKQHKGQVVLKKEFKRMEILLLEGFQAAPVIRK